MEIVGAVASIVTIAGLAKEVWILATGLLRDDRSAPQELLHISNQASLILHELECITGFQREDGHRGSAASITKEEAWILEQSLNAAKRSLSVLRRLCERRSRNGGSTSSRLAWALFMKKTVEEYLEQLHKTETSLGVILQVINLYVLGCGSLGRRLDLANNQLRRASAKAYCENARQNEEILRQLSTYHDEMQKARVLANQPTTQQGDSASFHSNALVAFRYSQSVSIPESWKQVLSSEVLLIRSENEFQTAYQLYARLPVFWFWGQKAFILSTSLRRMRTVWPNFQVLNGSLSFCNLVPVDSEVVKACKRGDIIAVRDLFRAHKASPTDVTDDDKSLLWVRLIIVSVVRYELTCIVCC
jgi:hypothetical protein